jgi:hypothetical protein
MSMEKESVQRLQTSDDMSILSEFERVMEPAKSGDGAAVIGPANVTACSLPLSRDHCEEPCSRVSIQQPSRRAAYMDLTPDAIDPAILPVPLPSCWPWGPIHSIMRHNQHSQISRPPRILVSRRLGMSSLVVGCRHEVVAARWMRTCVRALQG